MNTSKGGRQGSATLPRAPASASPRENSHRDATRCRRAPGADKVGAELRSTAKAEHRKAAEKRERPRARQHGQGVVGARSDRQIQRGILDRDP